VTIRNHPWRCSPTTDADRIEGDKGPDHLEGELGSDQIRGGLGDDIIFGGEDAVRDRIFGGKGKDNCYGNFDYPEEERNDVFRGCEKVEDE
jgi:Ca2+-binding RTX toxin-like protein